MQNQENFNCPFCYLESDRGILMESELSVAILDKYPVSPGHALIIPRRHCSDYFELTKSEKESCWELVDRVREHLLKKFYPDGFNIGINVGEAAGQTVPHVHLHIIPRYLGDIDDPEGGVRGVIPKNRKYRKSK